MKLHNQLKKMICEKSFEDIRPEDITFGKDLINNLGFSSIALILLVIDIEEEFGISLDDDEINTSDLSSYEFLYNTVASQIQRKESGGLDVY